MALNSSIFTSTFFPIKNQFAENDFTCSLDINVCVLIVAFGVILIASASASMRIEVEWEDTATENKKTKRREKETLVDTFCKPKHKLSKTQRVREFIEKPHKCHTK